MKGPRGRLLIAVVLAAAVVAIALIAALAGGGSGERGLRAELASITDLVVYVEEDDNRPEIAGRRRAVTLECVDRKGAVLVRGHHPWPFTDTDDGKLDPHVHQTVRPERAGDLDRCRLRETRGPLEGQVEPAA